MAKQVSSGEIYSKDFNTVNENDSLSDVWNPSNRNAASTGCSGWPKGKYVGMIYATFNSAFKTWPHENKVKTLMKAAPKVTLDLLNEQNGKNMISSAKTMTSFRKRKLIASYPTKT